MERRDRSVPEQRPLQAAVTMTTRWMAALDSALQQRGSSSSPDTGSSILG